jgi:hypothetical protein
MSRTHYELALQKWVSAVVADLYSLPQVVQLRLTVVDLDRYYVLLFNDAPSYTNVLVSTVAVPGDTVTTIRNRLLALVNADARLPVASAPLGDESGLLLTGRGSNRWTVQAGLSTSASDAFDVEVDAFDAQLVAEAQTCTVIFANDKGPRPAEPFISLQCVIHTPTGVGEEKVLTLVGSDDNGTWQNDQRYDGVCDVACYGPDNQRMLHSLHAAKWAPLDPDVLELAGVDVIDIATLASGADQDDTLWHSRSLAELRFRYTYRVSATLPVVRTVDPTPSLSPGA